MKPRGGGGTSAAAPAGRAAAGHPSPPPPAPPGEGSARPGTAEVSAPEPLPAAGRASRLVQGRVSFGSLPAAPRGTSERFSAVPGARASANPAASRPEPPTPPLPPPSPLPPNAVPPHGRNRGRAGTSRRRGEEVRQAPTPGSSDQVKGPLPCRARAGGGGRGGSPPAAAAALLPTGAQRSRAPAGPPRPFPAPPGSCRENRR